MGLFALSDLFGCAFTYHLSAFFAAFGTNIDDVVGTFDHFHVVFDDDDRMAP